jgi:hypothetical protein
VLGLEDWPQKTQKRNTKRTKKEGEIVVEMREEKVGLCEC